MGPIPLRGGAFAAIVSECEDEVTSRGHNYRCCKEQCCNVKREEMRKTDMQSILDQFSVSYPRTISLTEYTAA